MQRSLRKENETRQKNSVQIKRRNTERPWGVVVEGSMAAPRRPGETGIHGDDV
jgi:hypothetical protein